MIEADERFADYRLMRVGHSEESLRYNPLSIVGEIEKYGDDCKMWQARHPLHVCRSNGGWSCKDGWDDPNCLRENCPIIRNALSKMMDAVKNMVYVPKVVTPEKPITSYKDFIIGFIDIFIGIGFDQYPRGIIDNIFSSNHTKLTIHNTIDIVIEIKPSIRSAGELIRQMQTYRQFAQKDTVFVVISKTTAFKDILAQADIILINYADVLPSKDKQDTL